MPLYSTGDRISDLIMAQGQQEAERAERTWGGIGQAIGGLGEQASSYFAERSAKKEKGARDAAVTDILGSWDGEDPLALNQARLKSTDPKTAQGLTEGAVSLMRLRSRDPKADPKEAMANLPGLARGMEAAPESL